MNNENKQPLPESTGEEVQELALAFFRSANKYEIDFGLGWMKIFEAGMKAAPQQQSKPTEEQRVEEMANTRSNELFGNRAQSYAAYCGYLEGYYAAKPTWIDVSDELPPPCTVVYGYNKTWIDEDYNPEGIRECFIHDDGEWTSAKWNNCHDVWDTIIDSTPTHWMERAAPPKDKGI